MPINVIPGRLTLGIHLNDIPENAYFDQWPLEVRRDRAYYDTRANFQILGHVPSHNLPVKQELRCILPYKVGLEDWDPLSLPPRAVGVLRMLLENRIVPLVGYRVGAWVDIFGLAYDPDADEATIKIFASRRRGADIDARIPIMSQDEKRIETNIVLTNGLLRMLVEPVKTTAMTERYHVVLDILDCILPPAQRNIDGYNKYFNLYGFRSDPEGNLIAGFTIDEMVLFRSRLGDK